MSFQSRSRHRCQRWCNRRSPESAPRHLFHRARTKAELDEFRSLPESVFDNSPAELYLREVDGAFAVMNKWVANFRGREPQQMVGELASANDTGDEVEIARLAQWRLRATGRPVTQENH